MRIPHFSTSCPLFPVFKQAEQRLNKLYRSKYFHTNLQHCSDVGRLAFLDAQHGMSTIRAIARSMIAEEGSIGQIIDLLEDPEDARYNLKPEIEALKKTAKKCLASATAITAKFEYWYLVIICLKKTSLSKRGRRNTHIHSRNNPRLRLIAFIVQVTS